MISEHTKFAPDSFFAKVTKLFACNDVFTTEELATNTGPAPPPPPPLMQGLTYRLTGSASATSIRLTAN